MSTDAALRAIRSWGAALGLVLGLTACAPGDVAAPSTPPAPPSPPPTSDLETGQPWRWTGYETFPSLYFAAEPEGPFTDAQLAKIRRFELAIVEFRAGQFLEEFTTGLWAGGDLGGFMDAQARRIQADGGPPTLVYRSGMWAGSMFAPQRDLLERQALFLPDARGCPGFIDYPLDVGETGATTGLAYCRWDVRRADARRAFLDVVERAARGPAQGVFFDNGHSVPCDEGQQLSRLMPGERRAFLDAQTDLYADAFARLEARGRYPVLSTPMGFAADAGQVPWENACPRGLDDVVAGLGDVPFARNDEFWMWNLGEQAARQIRTTLEATRRGIPTIVHMPYFPDDGGCNEGCYGRDGTRIRFGEEAFLEFGMAAFLVATGPGSYFGFSDMQTDPEGGGWFDVSWPYYDAYDRVVTGRPLAEAVVSNDGMTFTRRFERGTVRVNVADGTYALDLEVPDP